MAVFYVGYDRADDFATTDSSTTSKEIELAINDAVGFTSREVDVAIEKIKQAFAESQGFTK